MPVIFQKRIYREDLRANPNVLYVFGDNEERVGLGGQAGQCRGEPNAIGVATKKSCSEFWCEENTKHQNAVIDNDLLGVMIALRDGRTVIWPQDGIGTGLSETEIRAPSSWRYLQQKIKELFALRATKYFTWELKS